MRSDQFGEDRQLEVLRYAPRKSQRLPNTYFNRRSSVGFTPGQNGKHASSHKRSMRRYVFGSISHA
ncbi:hypothetical protein CVT25_009977 [Psilocybe cyanescens]|uniref:Uncharacterized protein n=1 Tax=Psilocybe cyanescens TaxID=93625 RepID=A0A409XCS1_PSICY|nr:hypothetical protein CVT25_009977 [Psilocybe cyanescens]